MINSHDRFRKYSLLKGEKTTAKEREISLLTQMTFYLLSKNGSTQSMIFLLENSWQMLVMPLQKEALSPEH